MKDQNTSKQNKKIESQLAVKSTLLAESILDALVSTLLGPYLHYKASKLRNTKEFKNVQKRIKDLSSEYDELMKAQDKLDDLADKGTLAFKKSNDYSTDLAMKNLRSTIAKLSPKHKPTKRL